MISSLIDDIICLCTGSALGSGRDENQAQRWDSAWPAARRVQGRIVFVSGVMARGDLLDPDGLPRGAHEPSVRGPRQCVVPMVEAPVAHVLLLESLDWEWLRGRSAVAGRPCCGGEEVCRDVYVSLLDAMRP